MPAMSSAQETAFQSANAASHVVKSVDVGNMIVGIAGTLVLVWFCWVCISAYQSLRRPGVTASDAGGPVARAAFVMIVILALLTS